MNVGSQNLVNNMKKKIYKNFVLKFITIYFFLFFLKSKVNNLNENLLIAKLYFFNRVSNCSPWMILRSNFCLHGLLDASGSTPRYTSLLSNKGKINWISWIIFKHRNYLHSRTSFKLYHNWLFSDVEQWEYC